jgi:hypothetical protein
MSSDTTVSLAWGIGILMLALAATAARNAGLVDAETVTRLVMGASGLMIAGFGNRLPKAFVASAWARQARRVGGWSLVISGLVHASLFSWAPLPVALAGGSAAVLAGIAVTLGYCWV